MGGLDYMLRDPLFDHIVRMPAETATADDDIILPSQAASDWLRENQFSGAIGDWDSCLCNDARFTLRRSLSALDVGHSENIADMALTDWHYLLVSFERAEDAMLFVLKFGGASSVL